MPLTISLVGSLAAHNATFDFNNLSGRLALMIFCKMALNTDLDLLSKNPEMSFSRLYNPFWRVTEKFDGTHNRFRAARSEIFRIIDEIVQERRKLRSSGALEYGKDFLSTLLDNPSLEDDEKLLRDTLVTLLFAARDNIQNVLGWSLYELERSPQWLEKMRDESRNHADVHSIQYKDLSCGRTLRSHLERNTLFIKQCSMKLCDFGQVFQRMLGEVMVTKGDYVLWSDFAMMRDEKVWGADA
ncbi:hypothetical protein MPER_09226 [Moniliophthora perniciosa FA553]|nr:hypothetical protein MPER_09226 [Moniliophthora perniciosa FA553]